MDANDFKHNFVIGFPIDLDAMEVALIRKKRGPAFNLGKLNGAGGHQKIGESPVGAMRREAGEELGLLLPKSGQWQQFHYECRTHNGNRLWFYTANVPDLRNRVQTMTDEEVEIVSIPQLLMEMSGYADSSSNNHIEHLGSGKSDYVYNQGYLIPMAVAWLLNPEHQYVEQ